MKISKAFPSKWLKADDLPKGKKVRVTISHVEMADMGGEEKPALFFEGKDKGMVLNRTNAGRIVGAYGDDTEEWTGKDIFVYQEMVSFQGRLQPGLRVDVPMVEAAAEEEPPF